MIMMNQPTSEEENKNGWKKPGPDQDPSAGPDPKAEGCGGQPEVNGDDDKSGAASTPTSRAKKSVSWSEELVMESSSYSRSMPPSTDDYRSNPYVAYSNSPSDSSSFNFKGQYLIYTFIHTYVYMYMYIYFDIYNLYMRLC